jgi:5-formyltetrahydrofolate cyclo-ligase
MIWRGTHLRPLSQGPEHGTGVTGGTSNSRSARDRKPQLRRELRAMRAAIAAPLARRAARRAARHLLLLPELRQARSVGVYLACGSELDTAPLIAALHALDKTVCVPVMLRAEGRMRLQRLGPRQRLRRRRFGIREPAGGVPGARIIPDLVVLPLTAFDRHGLRLGSGGGYYDRWLSRLRPRPFCVGYAYAMQQVAALPCEPWDQRLDAVCTERGLTRFARR